MTSASFSNLSRISIAAVFTAAFLCLFPQTSHAQTATAQQPSGYAPPPMFDDMTPPMVRPDAQGGYIVQPKVSERPVVPETDNVLARPPVILPRVSVDPDAPKTTTTTTTTKSASQPIVVPAAPKPPVAAAMTPAVPTAPAVPATPAAPIPTVAAPEKPKMMKPIVEEVYIKREKTAVKKAAAIKTNDDEKGVSAPVPPKKPVSPVKSDKEPETQPVSAAKPVTETAPAAPVTTAPSVSAAPIRDPKRSAITGPVEMPALPAQQVEGKVLYQEAPADKTEPTILERQQQAAEKKGSTLVPIVPRPKDGVTPATFEPGDKQNALKKSIPFQAGQIALGNEDIDPIAAGVVKELDDEDHKDWRVQISAYATPYGTGLSSDRRIALSRALSLRTALITQGVAASKIDVRAEGVQNDGKPGDRIDLYLYGPAEK